MLCACDVIRQTNCKLPCRHIAGHLIFSGTRQTEIQNFQFTVLINCNIRWLQILLGTETESKIQKTWKKVRTMPIPIQMERNQKHTRCIMPALCMYLRPRKIWYTKNCTWSSDKRCVRMILFRSAPIKCVHKYTCWNKSIVFPPGWNTSNKPMTFSWFICFNKRSSRYVRFACTADWNGRASFLIATFML